jgi:hypothetical protein
MPIKRDSRTPNGGAFVYDNEGTPQWVQPHDALLLDALHSWVGGPATMMIHMQDEMAGLPVPSSGSGKKMRAQAAVLLQELQQNSRRCPKPLYRGAKVNPVGLGYQSWTTRRKTAEAFARRNDGTVWELPKGTMGLCVADYLAKHFVGLNAYFAPEAEWIVWQ